MDPARRSNVDFMQMISKLESMGSIEELMIEFNENKHKNNCWLILNRKIHNFQF
mgnify:FL=1